MLFSVPNVPLSTLSVPFSDSPPPRASFCHKGALLSPSIAFIRPQFALFSPLSALYVPFSVRYMVFYAKYVPFSAKCVPFSPLYVPFFPWLAPPVLQTFRHPWWCILLFSAVTMAGCVCVCVAGTCPEQTILAAGIKLGIDSL